MNFFKAFSKFTENSMGDWIRNKTSVNWNLLKNRLKMDFIEKRENTCETKVINYILTWSSLVINMIFKNINVDISQFHISSAEEETDNFQMKESLKLFRYVDSYSPSVSILFRTSGWAN